MDQSMMVILLGLLCVSLFLQLLQFILGAIHGNRMVSLLEELNVSLYESQAEGGPDKLMSWTKEMFQDLIDLSMLRQSPAGAIGLVTQRRLEKSAPPPVVDEDKSEWPPPGAGVLMRSEG